MRYNLFKKETADTWEDAKNKLIESICLNGNRVGKDYKLAFPRVYDKKIHFVYEGELKPFKILRDFSLHFYTDEECAALGYRQLKDGEIITDGKLQVIENPGEGYRWTGTQWLKEREFLIDIGSITIESEKEKARAQREKEFDAYHKLISNYNAGVVDLPSKKMDIIILWRAEWLNVPNAYAELNSPIEEIYPVLPERIKYYM